MTNVSRSDDRPISQAKSSRGLQDKASENASQLGLRMPVKQSKPDRTEKIGRRESRLGLRNIFGKGKLGPDECSVPELDDTQSSALEGIRAYENVQADSPPKNFSWKPLPVTLEDQEGEHTGCEAEVSSMKKKKRKRRLPTMRPDIQPKDVRSNSSLLPLFKAFPQAVRYATLPATLLPADTILRINEKKLGVHGKDGEDETNTVSPTSIDDQHEGDADKTKRRSRRNQSSAAAELEWTRKIYVLVPSGYLLQYSGQGTFDRLPERALKLGPASAAFATDAIPGRHWVVQISSAVGTGMGNTSSQEARSIFSKFSFKLTERRASTDQLMVFESAEDMEDWIRVLRGEIEAHGGKKKSETGRPVPEAPSSLYLREHVSQQTLVIRDSSRSASPRAATSHSMHPQSRLSGSLATVFSSSATSRSQSMDDISTTDSVVSHDERQLDNLRDNGNRLSLLSSGQPTVVTSTGSSPDGSPTLDKFEEEARPRLSNASELATRGDGPQRTSPSKMERAIEKTSSIQSSSSVGIIISDVDESTKCVGSKNPLNFSVPRASSSRRLSSVQGAEISGDDDALPDHQDQVAADSVKPHSQASSATSQPPVRCLSVLVEQGVTRAQSTKRVPTSPASPTSPGTNRRRWRSVSRGRATLRSSHAALPDVPSAARDPAAAATVGWRPCPRKIASTSALRRTSPSPSPQPPTARTRRPHIASMLASNFHVVQDRQAHRGSLLNADDVDYSHSPRGRLMETSWNTKRGSTGSVVSEESSRSDDRHSSTASRNPSSDSAATITMSSRSKLGHCLGVEKACRASLMSRRSMPHMAISGPPPAPPPTRALPPIPQRMPTKGQ